MSPKYADSSFTFWKNLRSLVSSVSAGPFSAVPIRLLLVAVTINVVSLLPLSYHCSTSVEYEQRYTKFWMPGFCLLVMREEHVMSMLRNLLTTHLEWADLADAHLEEAKLIRAHLEGAHLRGAHLEGADLRRAFLDIATNLDGTHISNSKGESVLLAGIHWGGVDLTMLNWGQVKMLGDEYLVRQKKRSNEDRKDKIMRLVEYEKAVRANRQLSVALQAQGLNEIASGFAYRAQVLQRAVFRL